MAKSNLRVHSSYCAKGSLGSHKFLILGGWAGGGFIGIIRFSDLSKEKFVLQITACRRCIMSSTTYRDTGSFIKVSLYCRRQSQ